MVDPLLEAAKATYRFPDPATTSMGIEFSDSEPEDNDDEAMDTSGYSPDPRSSLSTTDPNYRFPASSMKLSVDDISDDPTELEFNPFKPSIRASMLHQQRQNKNRVSDMFSEAPGAGFRLSSVDLQKQLLALESLMLNEGEPDRSESPGSQRKRSHQIVAQFLDNSEAINSSPKYNNDIDALTRKADRNSVRKSTESVLKFLLDSKQAISMATSPLPKSAALRLSSHEFSETHQYPATSFIRASPIESESDHVEQVLPGGLGVHTEKQDQKIGQFSPMAGPSVNKIESASLPRQSTIAPRPRTVDAKVLANPPNRMSSLKRPSATNEYARADADLVNLPERSENTTSQFEFVDDEVPDSMPVVSPGMNAKRRKSIPSVLIFPKPEHLIMSPRSPISANRKSIQATSSTQLLEASRNGHDVPYSPPQYSSQVRRPPRRSSLRNSVSKSSTPLRRLQGNNHTSQPPQSLSPALSEDMTNLLTQTAVENGKPIILQPQPQRQPRQFSPQPSASSTPSTMSTNSPKPVTTLFRIVASLPYTHFSSPATGYITPVLSYTNPAEIIANLISSASHWRSKCYAESLTTLHACAMAPWRRTLYKPTTSLQQRQSLGLASISVHPSAVAMYILAMCLLDGVPGCKKDTGLAVLVLEMAAGIAVEDGGGRGEEAYKTLQKEGHQDADGCSPASVTVPGIAGVARGGVVRGAGAGGVRNELPGNICYFPLVDPAWSLVDKFRQTQSVESQSGLRASGLQSLSPMEFLRLPTLRLAECYELGRGVSKSISKAEYYYQVWGALGGEGVDPAPNELLANGGEISSKVVLDSELRTQPYVDDPSKINGKTVRPKPQRQSSLQPTIKSQEGVSRENSLSANSEKNMGIGRMIIRGLSKK